MPARTFSSAGSRRLRHLLYLLDGFAAAAAMLVAGALVIETAGAFAGFAGKLVELFDGLATAAAVLVARPLVVEPARAFARFAGNDLLVEAQAARVAELMRGPTLELTARIIPMRDVPISPLAAITTLTRFMTLSFVISR